MRKRSLRRHKVLFSIRKLSDCPPAKPFRQHRPQNTTQRYDDGYPVSARRTREKNDSASSLWLAVGPVILQHRLFSSGSKLCEAARDRVAGRGGLWQSLRLKWTPAWDHRPSELRWRKACSSLFLPLRNPLAAFFCCFCSTVGMWATRLSLFSLEQMTSETLAAYLSALSG
jgi:hypothetical protein